MRLNCRQGSLNSINKHFKVLLTDNRQDYTSIERVTEACSRLIEKQPHPGPSDLGFFPTDMLLESKDAGHRKILLLLLSLLINTTDKPWSQIVADTGLPNLDGRALLIVDSMSQTSFSRFSAEFKNWGPTQIKGSMHKASRYHESLSDDQPTNLFCSCD
jgi:hypothetical protein